MIQISTGKKSETENKNAEIATPPPAACRNWELVRIVRCPVVNVVAVVKDSLIYYSSRPTRHIRQRARTDLVLSWLPLGVIDCSALKFGGVCDLHRCSRLVVAGLIGP